MRYTVRVVRDVGGLTALEAAWTELLRGSRTATVFASYQWAVAWWHHFGAGNRLHVLTVTDATHRLVGIAPLMVRPFGPFRKLEFIGTGLSDLTCCCGRKSSVWQPPQSGLLAANFQVTTWLLPAWHALQAMVAP